MVCNSEHCKAVKEFFSPLIRDRSGVFEVFDPTESNSVCIVLVGSEILPLRLDKSKIKIPLDENTKDRILGYLNRL